MSTENKPTEVRFDEPFDDQDWLDIGADLRIKIRKQFYQLKKENEQLKADLAIVHKTLEGQRSINDRQYDLHTKEIQQLKSKLEVAKKGLEFYADGEGDVLDWSGVNNSAYIQVKGKRAKQTLLEIEDVE